MSDYNPGPGGPYDKYGNAPYEPADPGGRGPYILLGILVAIGLIGGLLYFNGNARSDRTSQASAPIERTMPKPAPAPMAPAPATPAAPAAPSSTDNGATQKQ